MTDTQKTFDRRHPVVMAWIATWRADGSSSPLDDEVAALLCGLPRQPYEGYSVSVTGVDNDGDEWACFLLRDHTDRPSEWIGPWPFMTAGDVIQLAMKGGEQVVYRGEGNLQASVGLLSQGPLAAWLIAICNELDHKRTITEVDHHLYDYLTSLCPLDIGVGTKVTLDDCEWFRVRNARWTRSDGGFLEHREFVKKCQGCAPIIVHRRGTLPSSRHTVEKAS